MRFLPAPRPHDRRSCRDGARMTICYLCPCRRRPMISLNQCPGEAEPARSPNTARERHGMEEATTGAARPDWMDLHHTGPGTLAGRYLRRFWQPVYQSDDLPVGRTKPI